MPDPSGSDFAPWLQAGGVLMFAGAVWWEIRQLRPFFRSVAEDLAILKDRLAPREPSAPVYVQREVSKPVSRTGTHRAISPTIPTDEWEEPDKR